MNNFRSFLKEITTFRTVWIDKGQGRWAVKRKMHPFLRTICWVWVIMIGALIYAHFSAPETEAVNNIKLANNSKSSISETIIKNETENENERKTIILPLKPAAKLLETEKLPPVDFFKGSNIADNKYRILVNKSEYTLSLFKGDEVIKQYSIAVGKNPGDKQHVGDNRTPVGDFHVISIENASSWKHDFRDGKGKIKGAYGPWFIRLDAKGWKGIGIHGTHDPDSRGTMATEGCIRLSNDDIKELRQYAYLNMPVTIREN